MNVKCIPKKELFYNPDNGFRVVSCSVLKASSKINLSKYGTFTLSGTNIGNLQIGQEANLTIDIDENSKYDASYILLGYQGIGFKDGKISIDPKFELEILSRLMSKGQARNVNKAYPNFVNMILNDEVEKLDFNKIENVGIKRLPDYIDKVKKDCNTILFYPVCYEHNIVKAKDIAKISAVYSSPSQFENDIRTKPYYIYMKIMGKSFSTADKHILTMNPKFANTQHRCEYACVEVLKNNELIGNTRIKTKDLVYGVYQLAPECKEWIVKAVVDSKIIYYDDNKKVVSLLSTYKAECNIAEHIKERIKTRANKLNVNWEEYKNVDGFDCTDEQSEILKMVANGNRVSILTGGAGTGKTSSMKAVVNMLDEAGYDYLLLAPTGIAAKRLKEATGRFASTIHMYLASINNSDEPHIADYYILEESSMLSVHLLSTLLSSIGTEPNIIFVCDEAQLASISCGNIVQDLIDSNLVPRANLTKVFRYGIGGIATIATDTRMGNIDHINNQYDDFEFVEIDNDPISQIMDQYDKLLRMGYKKNEIMILSPYNKGGAGTYEINKNIQEKFNPNEFTPIKYKYALGDIQFKIGDMVINTKNNYNMPYIEFDEEGNDYRVDKFCANGDIGIVRSYQPDLVNHGKYELIVEFDNGMAIIDYSEVENLLLGYSISTHKCVTSDTLVLTSKGIKAIEDLFHDANKDTDTMVYNGHYFETPRNFVKNIPLPCKAITLKNGATITGTLEHGLTTINKDGKLSRVNIEELNVGDWVGLRIGANVYGDKVDLNEYNILRDGRENQNIIIPMMLSEDLATFLGYICADGTVYKSGFRFAKRNEEVIDYIIGVAKKEFNANSKKYYKIEKSSGKNGAWYGEINSTGLSKWMLSLGGLSPKNKYVPNCILEAPKNIQCKFLKGVFEDGTVNIKNGKFDHIEFVSTSRKCIYQVQNMLLNIGIISYVKKYSRKSGHCAYHLYIYRKDAIKYRDNIGFISFDKQKRLNDYLINNDSIKSSDNVYVPNIKEMCASKLLNENVDLSSSTKTALYYFTDEMLTRDMTMRIATEIKDCNKELSDYLYCLSNDFIFYPISNIEDCVEETYCFEMPSTHQFVQNGFMGWNCQGSQAKAIIALISPEHQTLLSRNLAYVEFSRAREMLIVLSNSSILNHALQIQENKQRNTWLGELLNE